METTGTAVAQSYTPYFPTVYVDRKNPKLYTFRIGPGHAESIRADAEAGAFTKLGTITSWDIKNPESPEDTGYKILEIALNEAILSPVGFDRFLEQVLEIIIPGACVPTIRIAPYIE